MGELVKSLVHITTEQKNTCFPSYETFNQPVHTKEWIPAAIIPHISDQIHISLLICLVFFPVILTEPGVLLCLSSVDKELELLDMSVNKEISSTCSGSSGDPSIICAAFPKERGHSAEPHRREAAGTDGVT